MEMGKRGSGIWACSAKLVLVFAAVVWLAACGRAAASQSAFSDGGSAAPSSTAPANYVVGGGGNSNVEQAHARLQGEGNRVYLIIVSDQSKGVEGDLYRDLRARNIRATAGPDEGIDTHGEFCYPKCVYVPREEVDAISVDAWTDVLRHEYRHITQAEHNPNMAHDFRDANGAFTTYAAFSEACADYGLNVAPEYMAQQRINQLKSVLGSGQQGLLDQACGGDPSAYKSLLQQYDQKAGDNTFEQLFPPFR